LTLGNLEWLGQAGVCAKVSVSAEVVTLASLAWVAKALQWTPVVIDPVICVAKRSSESVGNITLVVNLL
jgi:hypothetical protein